MNVLNKVGGAVLAAALLVAFALGSNTPAGREIWASFGTALRAIGDAAQDLGVQLNSTPVAGNAWAALGVTSVAFILTLILIPGLRAGRGFAVLAVVYTAIGFLLYQPSIIGG